ncbi:MAG: type IV toxin-antitoxin system AbiEi family antitoxin domain-containing protein [Treponema sp.]|jgi:predicted transcriptional regulator of viral defense system|nr:type IV toxin-antitoxin system AbiEi family antitoxin domain-containing protein [Treponema sp.]
MENNTVLQLLDQGKGLLFASKAVEAGLNRVQLSALVKDGFLERSGRGVYVPAGELGDEYFALQQRATKIVYSHETALFFHRLTDRTPVRYSITVPSSYKPSAMLKMSCKVFYIRQNLVDTGKIAMPSGMGHTIFTYDLERTVCDIVRSRNKIEGQIFIDTLKRYAVRKDKDLNRLSLYAKNFGISMLLHQYMEVLL